MVGKKQLAVTVAAFVALSGAACTTDQVGSSDPERVCPEYLPTPPEDAQSVDQYAVQVPDLPEPESAWLCRYTADAQDAPGVSDAQQRVWTLVDEPMPIPDKNLDAVSDLLTGLTTLPEDVVCTLDFGPRWLVTFVAGDDFWGAAVDSYGCHEVRLTDDPFTVAPGYSRVGPLMPGALGSPPGIVEELKSAAGID